MPTAKKPSAKASATKKLTAGYEKMNSPKRPSSGMAAAKPLKAIDKKNIADYEKMNPSRAGSLRVTRAKRK